MRRVLTRSILSGTLAATLFAGTALGHECIVISRSDTGSVAAGSHSARWLTVATLESLFTDPFLVPEPLEGDQLDWAVEQAREAGLPETFTIFVGAKTIADGHPRDGAPRPGREGDRSRVRLVPDHPRDLRGGARAVGDPRAAGRLRRAGRPGTTGRDRHLRLGAPMCGCIS